MKQTTTPPTPNNVNPKRLRSDLQTILATLPFDRSFEWGKWDCFQLCCWVRSTVAPELPSLPSMDWVYEKYPTEQEFPPDGIKTVMLEVRKSHPFYKRSIECTPMHLDILILTNGDRSNLGTALIDDRTGQTWVAMMGWTAHIVPIDRLAGQGWSIEPISIANSIATSE